MIATWRPVLANSPSHEREILADDEMHEAHTCIAVVENFGYGWFANAMPPQGDGTSSSVPGMVRLGNCGENIEEAKACCERICGLHPEQPGDRRSEGDPS